MVNSSFILFSMRHRLIILLAILLTSCAPASTVPPTREVHGLPFIIITPAGGSLATPTPFQPALATPLPTISSDTFSTRLPPLQLPTEMLGMLPTPTVAVPYPTAIPPPANLGEYADVITFLLIGSDKRPGSTYRTDTMVIAILRPKDDQVSLISIPRDLWVFIPGWEMQRINTAYMHGELEGYAGGGAQLLKDTIEYNLGLHIDHTAMVEFNGFRRIVDTLGGIDLPVACAYTDWRLISPELDPENEDNWFLYTTGPGLVHMDGDLALWYARSRSKSNDFDRGRRQQEVIRAIYSRALSGDTLTKIPQLYNDLNTLVATDLGLGDILKLASLAPGFGNADIRSYYIRPPIVSSWITPGGAYVLLPDQAALQGLVTTALTASPVAAVNETITVEVMNGTATDGWDALAASRLNYAGFVTNIKPADRRDYATSILVDLSVTPDYNRNAMLLNVMGFYPSQLVSIPTPNSPVQYRLILGYDYQPCFQPESLSP
ncbi:MAG: LCP family protein [Chloroflexi bacterium]|nr:LCP family protein [Chloroflexota bacterium]